MAEWTKEQYQLPENHGWVCSPGYKSFVADRGAVRFDIPSDWLFLPSDEGLKFHDREPPDDTCVLQLSVFHLRPDVDYRGLSIKKLLVDSNSEGPHEVIGRGDLHYRRQGDLEIAWQETRYVEPNEKREARSRCLMARRGTIQPLITLAFWPEDVPRLMPAWDELLRTLRLGEFVASPIPRNTN